MRNLKVSSHEKRYHDPFNEILNSITHAPKRVLSKPFIKWVGGKRSALDHLKKRIPKEYSNYYEVFLGGGALFFEIQPKTAILSDINDKLILTYKAIKQDVDSVIKELKKHEKNNSKEYFYKMRDKFNKEKELIKLASLFIYLNKTCFNGLYRVNQSGWFNVPYGQYNNPRIADEKNLRNVSELLKKVKLNNKSFNQTKIQSRSFYYLDPPYHQTFDQYDENQFNLSDHEKLRDFCKSLDKNQAFFMLSNSDTKEIRKLYKDFNVETIEANKSVSCKVNGRGKEKELIIRNYG